jgi:hypothetical protein
MKTLVPFATSPVFKQGLRLSVVNRTTRPLKATARFEPPGLLIIEIEEQDQLVVAASNIDIAQ